MSDLKINTFKNVRHTFSGFFNFYGKLFRFKTQAICILAGRICEKSVFSINNQNLPKELTRFVVYTYICIYFNKIKYVYRLNLFNTKGASDTSTYNIFNCSQRPLCIQDPFQLMCNVGGFIEQTTVDQFVQSCKDTSQRMENIVCSKNEKPQFKPINIVL